MKTFHAVMSAFGNEFPVTFESESLDAAIDYLCENYEESSIAEIGDTEYWQQKEYALYASLESEYY